VWDASVERRIISLGDKLDGKLSSPIKTQIKISRQKNQSERI